MGGLEVVGVASILPFMQLISDPGAVDQSSWLTSAYEFFQFSSHREMMIYFGIVIILVIGITSAFSILTTWMQYKYSWDIAHNLGIRLLKSYLKKPYSFYLKQNTTEIQTYVISEVGSLTGGVIIPIIELISRSFISLIIFALLLFVDVKIALISFFALGGFYFLIYVAQKNFLKKIGQHRIDMNLQRYKNLGELFDGIKTVMVYNKMPFFYKRYSTASREFCDVQPKYNLLLAAPRYVLEFLAFGSILSITLYLFTSSGNIQNALPRLSLYAVAGYRLLPALQKAFAAAAKMRHNFPILNKLHGDLIKNNNPNWEPNENLISLPFNKTIAVSQVDFQYDNAEQKVINKLSVRIPKGKTVAFIGSTGSGKTTLVDLIVGLFTADAGTIKVDGELINSENLAAWQNQIAYVPQDVFLFDDTLMNNVTLSENDGQHNLPALEKATRAADIYQFIQKELPKGFMTEIGEKGVRLSGGQRQRLGLARALYATPQVLVLDEATSALDSITEKGIIESLQNLPEDLTTIIIAHRLSTVKHADCIYILKDGQIVAEGNYDDLMVSNEAFKTMAQLS